MRQFFSIGALAVAFSFAIPLAASAQSTIPQIHVQDVKLDASGYAAGSTVNGTATLINASGEDAQDISYTAQLVGEYDNTGIARAAYATSKLLGPVYLSANEHKQVSFSITLPATVPPAKLGIEVQAMLGTGLPLGWQDVPIVISGNAQGLSVTNAYVTLDTSIGAARFAIDEGPTALSGQVPYLFVTLKNVTNTPVSFIPTTTIYNRTVGTGDPLFSKTYDAISVPGGKATTTMFALPDFNGGAGVYAGTLAFSDAQGTSAAALLSFRYIIGGDIAAIQAVSSDAQSGASGKTIHVTATVSGTPLDISNGVASSSSPAILSVSLFNEHDTALGTGSATIDLMHIDNGGVVTIPITLSEHAEALRAEVSITKDGRTLASKAAPLSAFYEKLHGPAAVAFSIDFVWVGLAFIVAVLIALIVYMRIQKRRIPPQMPAAGGMIALLLMVGLCTWVSAVAHAYTLTDPYWHVTQYGQGTPPIFINAPFGELQPGQQFYVTGSTVWTECNNSSYYRYEEATFQGVTQSTGGYSSQSRGRGDSFTLRNSAFSVGPFTAPTTPGTYQVNIGNTITIYNRGNAPIVVGAYGYQEFTVAGPTDMTCPGDPNCPNTTPPGSNPRSNGGSNGGNNGGDNGAGACQANAHKDGSACVCDDGYLAQGAACVLKTQCNDAIDNNGDTLIDANDPGCKGGFGKEGIPDASLKLVPDKNPVQKNQIVTFSYLVENIVSGLCKLSGNNGDSFALSGNAGSQKTSPIQNETTFTLVCQALKDKANVSTSVTIKVAPNFNEF